MYHILSCFEKRTVSSCNFNLLSGATAHPDRILENTHDLLYILEGEWTVCQEEETYRLGKDDAVFLHAGRHHFGREGCLPNTLVMFLHFSRSPRDCTVRTLEPGVSWEDAVAFPSILHCRHNSRVKTLLKNIIYSFYADAPHRELKVAALLPELLVELSAVQDGAGLSRGQDEIVDKVLYLIRLSPQKYFTTQELAREVFLGASALQERFKKATGTTLHQYQLDNKLSMARALLMTEEAITLKKIAALYGFCDEYHFSRLFKKKYGVSPSVFREHAGRQEAMRPVNPAEAGQRICW